MVVTVRLGIDSSKAKEIAIRFFEQHYSVLEIKEPTLQDDIWTVTILLSSHNDQIRKVRIDAKTGELIDWSR